MRDMFKKNSDATTRRSSQMNQPCEFPACHVRKNFSKRAGFTPLEINRADVFEGKASEAATNRTFKRKRSPSLTGFTYIEVMIVSIITLIIMLIATANFKGIYRGMKLERTAKKVVSFLRYAQTQAVTKREQYTLDILADENRLLLRLDNDKKVDLELPAKYSMETDASKIIFGYTGGFDIAGLDDPKNLNKLVGSITIMDENGREAKVEFWAFGGYIRLKSKHFGKIPPS